MATGILSVNHWTLNCFRQRITTKQLRQILLQDGDRFFRAGRFVHLKKRRLGAGVYEVWFEDKGR